MIDWLVAFGDRAAQSDQLRARPEHRHILAAGLFGEVGSILAELKKTQREGSAYPRYRQRQIEEFGDVLWYFVRLTHESDPGLIRVLPEGVMAGSGTSADLGSALELGWAVGDLLRVVADAQSQEVRGSLLLVWQRLSRLAEDAGVSLQAAAEFNVKKISSRWPTSRTFCGLFDDGCPVEEQIPRSLTVDFLERLRGTRTEVLLQYRGITVGDRLTDNISDPDGYRFHDVFHIAYAVFLGWSPVTRALLRCKRKSAPEIDENQDGARASIVEEAVAALVFSRAKHMRFFAEADQVDYDLLKSVQELVTGYEVATVPAWQWELAILQGFRIFRLLVLNRGGTVSWDLVERRLEWAAMDSRA